ncbi:Hypothetical predicted protein, partial [Paramuricea clavata]
MFTEKCLLAWLDLRNAFGSVPHEVIEITLSHLGVPQSVVELMKNVYTDANTVVRTPAGLTSDDMVKIRDRHNSVVDRFSKAIRYGHVKLDQQVDGSSHECRPNIVINEGNQVTVIDVTCPFDNGENALKAAEDYKVSKYHHLIDHFRSVGKECHTFGF